MDGYTVKEAALALGIPKKRVWELVARGVLNGRREGDRGMRVYLQTPDAPGDEDESGPPNVRRGTEGDRGRAPVAAPQPAPVPEPLVEASPFRELLTEFRNLTERYGQALLALGEARGEVAALRTRVELLEARMDLRLPGGPPSPPVSWRTPEPLVDKPTAAPASEPDAGTAEETPSAGAAGSVDRETATEAAEGDGEEPRPKARRHGRRFGGPGILEALARAEDPALAELPGAREAGEAMAAFQAASGERETPGTDAPAGVQAEEPAPATNLATGVAAESAAVAGEDARPETAEEELPGAAAAEAMPVADESEPALGSVAVPEIAASEIAASEEEPVTVALEVEGSAPGVAMVEPEPVAPIQESVGPTDEVVPAEKVAAEDVAAAEEVAAVPEGYSAETEEPDWYVDEDLDWLDAADYAPPAPPAPPVMPEPEPQPEFEPEAEPAHEPEPEPEPVPEPEPDPELEPAHEPEPEPQPEPEPEPEPEREPEPQAEPEPEPLPEAEPEPQLQPEPEPEAEPEPEPLPEAEPEPQLQPEPEPVPQPGREPQPEPEPEPESEPEPERMAAAEPEPLPEPEPQLQPEPEPVPQPGPEPEPESERLPERMPEPEPEPEREPELMAEPEPALEPEVQQRLEPPPEAAPEPPPEAEHEPFPTDEGGHPSEEAVLFLGDEGADELEQGASGWHRPPAPAHAPPPAEPPASPAAPVDERLAAVAAEEGWDEEEVAGVRAYLEQVPHPPTVAADETASQPPLQELPPPPERETSEAPGSPPIDASASSDDRSIELPGADELDEAMSALGRPAASTDQAPTAGQPEQEASASIPSEPPVDRAWAKPAVAPDEGSSPWPARDPGVTNRPGSVTGFHDRSADAEDPTAEPEWLRGRRDAAARAYRRLRRILPTNER